MIPNDAAGDCTITRAKNEGYRTKILCHLNCSFASRLEINTTLIIYTLETNDEYSTCQSTNFYSIFNLRQRKLKRDKSFPCPPLLEDPICSVPSAVPS